MHADLLPRPALVSPAAIADALDRLAAQGSPAEGSRMEVWRALTERFTIDLDAAAAILPAALPEPRWLRQRG